MRYEYKNRRPGPHPLHVSRPKSSMRNLEIYVPILYDFGVSISLLESRLSLGNVTGVLHSCDMSCTPNARRVRITHGNCMYDVYATWMTPSQHLLLNLVTDVSVG